MNVLDEAKEIMKKAGCKKAFAVYGLELNDIAEVKDIKIGTETLPREEGGSSNVSSIEIILTIKKKKSK